MNTTQDGGHQQGRGLRGDPVARSTTGDGTRDTAFSDPDPQAPASPVIEAIVTGTTSPQRYDLMTNNRCGSSIEEMEPADDGVWVRWEDVEVALASHADLVAALKESIKLQSHYANLLNMQDGGNRLTFEHPAEWINRLATLAKALR